MSKEESSLQGAMLLAATGADRELAAWLEEEGGNVDARSNHSIEHTLLLCFGRA